MGIKSTGSSFGENIVVSIIYASWLVFVFSLITLASVLAYKSGHLSWLNLLWLILILSPKITTRG